MIKRFLIWTFACLMMGACMGLAFGQEAVQVDPVGTVDIAKFFSNVRAGYLFGHDKMAAAYIPLVSLKGHGGAEYLNLDAGVGYNTDTRVGKPITALGFRFDSLLSKIGAWKPTVTTAVLPPIETGPTVMIDFGETKPLSHVKFMWLLALKIGGK